MSNLKAENDKLLAKAQEERSMIIKEAKDSKAAIISEAKDKASAEARRIVETAKVEIENQRKAAMVELKNQLGTIALDIAEQVIKKELKGIWKELNPIQIQNHYTIVEAYSAGADFLQLLRKRLSDWPRNKLRGSITGGQLPKGAWSYRRSTQLRRQCSTAHPHSTFHFAISIRIFRYRVPFKGS